MTSTPEDRGDKLRLLSHVFRIAYEALDKARNSAQLSDDALDQIDGPREEGTYRWNPFEHYARKVEDAFGEARAELIKEVARRLNSILTPNLKEDREDWKKHMDGWAGKEGFDFGPLLTFFTEDAKDKDALRAASLVRLRDQAGHLIPWSETGDWNKPRGPVLKREGRMLLLRSYCWHEITGSSGYVSISDTEPLLAFDILIDAALNGCDPATWHEAGPLTDHARESHNDPAKFFAKVRVLPQQDAYESFQFYKNGSLKVWFKDEQAARMVGEMMVGKGEAVPLSQEAGA